MKRTAAAFLLVLIAGTISAQTATYPLHVGDRWFWYFDELTIVGDTIMPNGETYFTFEDNWVFPRLQRYTSDQVYIYDVGTASDQLWYDFTLSPGDTVNLIDRGTDTTIIFFSYSRVDSIFGVERRQWHFLIDFALQLIDDEEEIVVTDSLGVTEFCRCGIAGPIYIGGAVINGVQYGDVTSVSPDDGRPSKFSLSQNYPNPFNPTTTFSFTIPARPAGGPQSSIVNLKVFDLLGQEVATIVNERLDAGSYTRQWNATGSPSGVYFYRLQAGGFTETRKLILLR